MSLTTRRGRWGWARRSGPAILAVAAAMSLAVLAAETAHGDPTSSTTETSPSPSPTTTPPPSTTESAVTTSEAARPFHPQLTLSVSQGAPGSHLRATVTGVSPCQQVSFGWDGANSTPVPAPSGTASADLTVPEVHSGTHLVTATCADAAVGPMARQKFIVTTAQPTLTLEPDTGDPGGSTTATAAHLGCDTATFDWDGSTPLGTVPVESGSAAKAFTIPEQSDPGAHTVTVTCGDTRTPGTFTVHEQPSLVLEPSEGVPGTSFSATVRNLGLCRLIQYSWGDKPLESTPRGATEVTLKVPQDADATEHTVTATCVGTSRKAQKPFRVLSPVTGVVNPPVTPTAPSLLLDHSSGHAGDPVRATGDGFACADGGPVSLSWVGNAPLPAETPSAEGHFEARLTVPVSTADHLTLRASCAPGIEKTVEYTLLGSPTTVPPPLPPERHFPWVLIALALLALAGAGLAVKRLSRKPSPTSPRVHTVVHDDALPAVTVQETPQPGETSHVLRAEVHSETPTITIEEVHDDHTVA